MDTGSLVIIIVIFVVLAFVVINHFWRQGQRAAVYEEIAAKRNGRLESTGFQTGRRILFLLEEHPARLENDFQRVSISREHFTEYLYTQLVVSLGDEPRDGLLVFSGRRHDAPQLLEELEKKHAFQVVTSGEKAFDDAFQLRYDEKKEPDLLLQMLSEETREALRGLLELSPRDRVEVYVSHKTFCVRVHGWLHAAGQIRAFLHAAEGIFHAYLLAVQDREE